EQHLDFFTGLRRYDLIQTFVVPFFELDHPFTLVADVDHHVVADDAQDASLDDLVDLKLLLLLRQPVGTGPGLRLVEGLFQLSLQFSFGKVELAEEITIHHSDANSYPGSPGHGEPSKRDIPLPCPPLWRATSGVGERGI